jgi:hypothetical protein
MKEGFEILVNGIPRTFRDLEKNAIASGRALKRRDISTEITIINTATRQWLVIADPFGASGQWKSDAPLRTPA